MVKKEESESKLWNIVPLAGIIALIGGTMAIFEIPYGDKIALAGAMWFIVLFVLAILWIATKEHERERVKKK